MSDTFYFTDVAMIVCVVDAGNADTILLAAQEMGARNAIVSHARGWGTRERLGALGVAVETEKEVVSIIVSAEQQDLMFDGLYRAGRFDLPGRGYIGIMPLDKAASYVPKAVRERLDIGGGEEA